MNWQELLVGAFLLLFVSCVKENNCTVSKIYTGNETVSEISVNENTTVLTIEKEYIVALECY
jgi:hypothetical protein